MRTVLSVIGTRPEAVKMAPVVLALRAHPGRVRSIVCSTGQHREMLDPILALFGIEPDADLGVMRPNQALSALPADLLMALEPVVADAKPDWILAQGDTTTVLAAALSAYYHQVPFGHVEAGLRTGDRYQPFPEEMNRRIGDGLAELLFALTALAREALLGEGTPERRIVVTGNTVVDAVLSVAEPPYDWEGGPLAGLPADGRWVLITAHRRESFGAPLAEICRAICELAERFRAEQVQFIYPVHLNPNVNGPVRAMLDGIPNVHLLPPLDYLSLVQLMQRCTLILTDSGGIQEEAPAFHVPVLVLREVTERPEGIAAGVSRLVGTDCGRIVHEATTLLEDATARAAMSAVAKPYGDGKAAGRIVSALLAWEAP